MKNAQKSKKLNRNEQRSSVTQDPKVRAHENLVLHTPAGEMPDTSALPSKTEKFKK